MEIHPSILARTEEEFRRKVEHVRFLSLPLHVDVMDGKFVPYETWADPWQIMYMMEDLQFNAHLMVRDPEHSVPVWSVSGARRVYFHIESTSRSNLIIKIVKKQSEIGLVLNPETPVSSITEYLDHIASVLVMTVEPGRGGQEMRETLLHKVEQVKKIKPNLHVMVDGGVNTQNIAMVDRAGADAVVVGSALTNQPDPLQALKELNEALRLGRLS